ncbi:MAG: DUF305 domain-containing protein, partial [Solirubrobacterales bacterium]|nr:DUF305 domain-containing protein [Solirubrobacterales bacterium]
MPGVHNVSVDVAVESALEAAELGVPGVILFGIPEHKDPTGADRAFATAMVPHHESAVEMAQIATRRAESDFVRDLAKDIITAQRAEIATLKARERALASGGVPKGDLGVAAHDMGMDDDPAMLEHAASFDAAFLKMMIPHHEGAIAMAKAELDKGGDGELRDLAERIIDAQEREIGEMQDHLGGKGAHSGHR